MTQQKSLIQSFDDEEAYKNFTLSLRSPATKFSYVTNFKVFLNFTKVNSYSELLSIEPKKLQSIIRDYIVYLREHRKIRTSTIKVHIAIIKHFFEINNYEGLHWYSIQKFKGSDDGLRRVRTRPYTREEIKRVLDGARDHRAKIVILLMASAGVRVGALTYIRLRNLKPMDKEEIYQLTVYENTEEEYTTFCTPECRKEIELYLEYRQRLGENLTPDSWLIRDEFDPADNIRINIPYPLSSRGLITLVERAMSRDSGLKRKSKDKRQRHEVMTTHSLRKFFDTMSRKSGVYPDYVELLMGHTLQGVRDSYFLPTPLDLLYGTPEIKGYVAAINNLTIIDENRLKIENKKLIQKIEEIEVTRKDLEKFEQKMLTDINNWRLQQRQQRQQEQQEQYSSF